MWELRRAVEHECVIAIGTDRDNPGSRLLLAQSLRGVSEQHAQCRGTPVTGNAVRPREQLGQLVLDGCRESRTGRCPITVGDRSEVTVEGGEDRRLVIAAGRMPKAGKAAVGPGRAWAAARARAGSPARARAVARV